MNADNIENVLVVTDAGVCCVCVYTHSNHLGLRPFQATSFQGFAVAILLSVCPHTAKCVPAFYYASIPLLIDGARDIFDILAGGDFFFSGQDFSYSFKPELSVTSIDVATVLSLLALLVQKYKY